MFLPTRTSSPVPPIVGHLVCSNFRLKFMPIAKVCECDNVIELFHDIHSFHRMLRQLVVLKSILEPFKQSVQVVYSIFSIVVLWGILAIVVEFSMCMCMHTHVYICMRVCV